MKSREKVFPLIAGIQSGRIVPFYEGVTRDQMSKRLFYEELFKHYMRITFLVMKKKNKIAEHAKKQLYKAQEKELFLSYKFNHG
jgi:hypothetical protein